MRATGLEARVVPDVKKTAAQSAGGGGAEMTGPEGIAYCGVTKEVDGEEIRLSGVGGFGKESRRESR